MNDLIAFAGHHGSLIHMPSNSSKQIPCRPNTCSADCTTSATGRKLGAHCRTAAIGPPHAALRLRACRRAVLQAGLACSLHGLLFTPPLQFCYLQTKWGMHRSYHPQKPDASEATAAASATLAQSTLPLQRIAVPSQSFTARHRDPLPQLLTPAPGPPPRTPGAQNPCARS